MSDAGRIILNQGDKPISPDANKIAFYSKTDDKLYYLTASGVEYWVTASGVLPPINTLLSLSDTPAAYSDGLYLKSTASGTVWATASGGGGGTSDHSALLNLDYASANHTGFQPAGDYATNSGVATISGVIVSQIPTDFYTQAEVDSAIDTASGTLQSQITSNASGINTLDNQVDFLNVKIDTTSGTLQGEIDGLTLDHDALNNLSYATAGHTGFASTAALTTVSGALQSGIDGNTTLIGNKFDKAGGTITGDTTIQGNLTVTGTQFIAHTEDLLVKDNLIVINSGETGGGVTKGHAGMEVDRGSETNYQFMFVEADDNFQVGISGSTQPVATRMDSADMDDGYVTYWDASNYRLVTESGIAVANIASTTDLTTTSGVLQDGIDNNTTLIGTTSGTLQDNIDAIVPGITEVSEDTSPQLGGDLDLNEFYIELTPAPASDDTGSGSIATMTVDANATGVGAALHMDTDGNWIEADASADTTMPCGALALETSTGSKKVLLQGFIRSDSWTWTVGGIIYVSETAGALTQTAPTTAGAYVQAVGFATHADRLYFSPSYVMGEVA